MKTYRKNKKSAPLLAGKPAAKSGPASVVGRSSFELNPSSPFLTDEQRKEMMARREKLIAASAQKHAED